MTPDEIIKHAPCPHCHAERGAQCTTSKGRSVPMHAARRNQLCQELFIESVYAGPTCGKFKDHPGQHCTLDRRTRWSKGGGITLDQLRKALSE